MSRVIMLTHIIFHLKGFVIIFKSCLKPLIVSLLYCVVYNKPCTV